MIAHLPAPVAVDIIKIDKSFVDGLGSTGPGLAIATSIVRIAHDPQLKTVVEGVEQPQQRARSAAMGCDEARDTCSLGAGRRGRDGIPPVGGNRLPPAG